jgi:ribosomal protein S18 acetylase RimI-like enzyme
MAVLPSARGQRIGELLLGHIQTLAISQGFKRLLLSTTPFLTRAIQLYERSGFQKTDEGPHDLFGTPLFTMVKNLNNL